MKSRAPLSEGSPSSSRCSSTRAARRVAVLKLLRIVGRATGGAGVAQYEVSRQAAVVQTKKETRCPRNIALSAPPAKAQARSCWSTRLCAFPLRHGRLLVHVAHLDALQHGPMELSHPPKSNRAAGSSSLKILGSVSQDIPRGMPGEGFDRSVGDDGSELAQRGDFGLRRGDKSAASRERRGG